MLVNAEQSSRPVVIMTFDRPVDPGSAAFVTRAVNYAIGQNASAIVIVMNTPGGLLSDMLSIVSSIVTANQSSIPTYTFVVPNGLAASAGSYIALATNRIFMGSGSIIGPSTPVVVGGSPLEQNHTQAAMLQLLVSLAQKWGRNTTATYYMVQQDRAFSADEALKYHLVEGRADSVGDVIGDLGLSSNPQINVSENLYDQFISALSNPILDGVLILLGILIVVLDIYHPTIVLTVAGVVAIVAGLIGAEVVSASILGFIVLAIAAFLIVIELKLGHGLSMIAGVVLGAFGVLYLAQGLSYSPSPITPTTELELFLLVVAGIVGGLYFRWVIGPLRRRSKLTGPETMVGQLGLAMTDLKPDGDVKIGGIIWRAKSSSGDIVKGESVRIKSLEGLVVIVEKQSPDVPIYPTKAN